MEGISIFLTSKRKNCQKRWLYQELSSFLFGVLMGIDQNKLISWPFTHAMQSLYPEQFSRNGSSRPLLG